MYIIHCILYVYYTLYIVYIVYYTNCVLTCVKMSDKVQQTSWPHFIKGGKNKTNKFPHLDWFGSQKCLCNKSTSSFHRWTRDKRWATILNQVSFSSDVATGVCLRLSTNHTPHSLRRSSESHFRLAPSVLCWPPVCVCVIQLPPTNTDFFICRLFHGSFYAANGLRVFTYVCLSEELSC